MGRIVIATYRPKQGQSAALKELMKTHVAILRSQDLVTERTPILMEAADGTIIEVFEWQSKEAIESAHSNPAVLEMWAAYAKVCEYIPVGEVSETGEIFAEFTPLN